VAQPAQQAAKAATPKNIGLIATKVMLSARKVGISEPPAVLAQPKGRMSRRVHCVSGVIDDYIFGARIEA